MCALRSMCQNSVIANGSAGNRTFRRTTDERLRRSAFISAAITVTQRVQNAIGTNIDPARLARNLLHSRLATTAHSHEFANKALGPWGGLHGRLRLSHGRRAIIRIDDSR